MNVNAISVSDTNQVAARQPGGGNRGNASRVQESMSRSYSSRTQELQASFNEALDAAQGDPKLRAAVYGEFEALRGDLQQHGDERRNEVRADFRAMRSGNGSQDGLDVTV